MLKKITSRKYSNQTCNDTEIIYGSFVYQGDINEFPYHYAESVKRLFEFEARLFGF